jgi:L-asparagine transporter-like permease
MRFCGGAPLHFSDFLALFGFPPSYVILRKTMKEPKKESKKKGKGVMNLLVVQFLLGVLIYVALTYYPTEPKITLTVIYILVLGILYFSWKGLKELWRKEADPPPAGRSGKP